MIAKQLSIFLENKSGSLTDVTEILSQAHINLSSMNIADNSDFGILRCIVSDPEKACKVLRENNFAVKMTDVIGFTCPNTAGALARVMRCLSENGIFIEYLYSFNAGEIANIIIRPTDLQQCERVLEENKVHFIAADELNRLWRAGGIFGYQA